MICARRETPIIRMNEDVIMFLPLPFKAARRNDADEAEEEEEDAGCIEPVWPQWLAALWKAKRP
jgi:hypothetical protein